jgi:hypothetical protein
MQVGRSQSTVPEVSPVRRIAPALSVIVLALTIFTAAPAEGGSTHASGCGVQAFEYAGVQASNMANGVRATLSTTIAPAVTAGHVGGWIGLGGPSAGPGGAAEWIQAGLAAFQSDDTSQMYYEVTVAGQQPKYVEIGARVTAGHPHRFAILELAARKSVWRVWVDGRPVSPPIYLPGSHNTWYPQAVAENWNGGTGACNTYSYRFTDVSLAGSQSGSWRPLSIGSEFEDPGYHVVPLSAQPRTFLAASLGA